jgi:hypothetical protein
MAARGATGSDAAGGEWHRDRSSGFGSDGLGDWQIGIGKVADFSEFGKVLDDLDAGRDGSGVGETGLEVFGELSVGFRPDLDVDEDSGEAGIDGSVRRRIVGFGNQVLIGRLTGGGRGLEDGWFVAILWL